MRRPVLGWAVLLGLSFLLLPSNRAQAQGVFNDPFSFYYGYYLPHAAYVAAQPTPLDTINAMTAVRQGAAVTDRAGLYDPISPYGEEELDPSRPFAQRRGGGGRPSIPQHTANAKGGGPKMYYNRTAQYYPTIALGRGPNRNITIPRGARSSGGFGMPSMPSMPGPR
jgi:hypothetical protein